MYSNFFFNHAIYEVMWKNIVEPVRPQMTTWHMQVACWVPKATNAHSEYLILSDFPQQQWLDECTSMLSYMYVSCLVE
jgi:hypothetical protein